MRRVGYGVVLLCLWAWVAVAAMASEYHGQVVFGGLPLPGSTVTVTATQGDKKAVAVSDDQGVFAFPDLADGKWTLTIEMTGFAPLQQEVTIAPNAQPSTFELKLLSLDQIRAETKPVKVDMTQLAAAAPTAISEPSVAAAPSGPQAAGAAPARPAAPSASSQQASGGLLINGSQSNAATSQFSMNQAFGNARNRRSLYNGMLSLQLNNSALDAAPYSLYGAPETRPQFNNYTARFDFGGPLNIKHLMPHGPYFGVFYTHSQNNNYNTQNALIPTALQGAGNLSSVPGP
ncbi:MAG TPA: carboxypeptidase-like regulatory domain-containing protein, partial [Acidobacteriaceae bacterium]|nr:carboxypeptidase-like regulatory domain-containing protein [Acidobacteriaceae bacterium]